MREFKGKIAVVTGASEGIGRAISLALAAEGVTIAAIARKKDKLQRLAGEVKALGVGCEIFPCDAGDEKQVVKTMAAIYKKFVKVDILINNAGLGTFKPFDRIDMQELLRPVHLPVASSILCTRLVIDDMLRRGEGHIVNLTSPAGYFPLPFMLPYTAARHAVVGFSLGLREEVADRGVGVSLICPAQVNTGYFQKNDANMDWYPKISKLFPVLQPEQVAARVIDAIRHNKREVIFPFVLWLITRFYQTLPRLSLAFLKLFGLFRPSAR